MEPAKSMSTNINTKRNCMVEITNMSNVYNLINAKFYTYSGYCCDPPQPTISTKNTGVCAFTKSPDTARGAVGVLSYDLCHMENQMCSDRMAILFSVPYSYKIFKNIFGVGLFKSTRPCDTTLYHCMYYGKDFRHFTRGKAEVSGIIYKGETVELRAAMSNVGKAIITLEIHDKKK